MPVFSSHLPGFIRTCYYFGAPADFIAGLPLFFPDIAKLMFGLDGFNADNGYLYVSRIGASLMLGWTLLLVWGSFKPQSMPPWSIRSKS